MDHVAPAVTPPAAQGIRGRKYRRLNPDTAPHQNEKRQLRITSIVLRCAGPALEHNAILLPNRPTQGAPL